MPPVFHINHPSMPQTKCCCLSRCLEGKTTPFWLWQTKLLEMVGRQSCLGTNITNQTHANHSSHSNPLGPTLWSHILQLLAQSSGDHTEDLGCRNEKLENISQPFCAKWLQKRCISGNLQRHKTEKSVTTAQTVKKHVSCIFFWVSVNCCKTPNTENYCRHC